MVSAELEAARRFTACSKRRLGPGARRVLTGKEAHGADVGRLLLVAPLVEEATDLVHPAVAHIALDPPLLRLLIILPLFQLVL